MSFVKNRVYPDHLPPAKELLAEKEKVPFALKINFGNGISDVELGQFMQELTELTEQKFTESSIKMAHFFNDNHNFLVILMSDEHRIMLTYFLDELYEEGLTDTEVAELFMAKKDLVTEHYEKRRSVLEKTHLDSLVSELPPKKIKVF